jgi:hypothetical protein
MSAAAGRGTDGGKHESSGQGCGQGDASPQAKEMPESHSRPFVRQSPQWCPLAPMCAIARCGRRVVAGQKGQVRPGRGPA